MINKTRVQDPSPTFVQGYLAGLQGRSRADELNSALNSGDSIDAADSSDPAGDNEKGLGIDTSAAQYPTPEYTLESLTGLDPNDPFAKQIVKLLMGIEDASPNMIQDIMRDAGIAIARSSAPSPEPRNSKIYTEGYTYICPCEVNNTPISSCHHTEGEVTVLEHEPGANDVAAGALQRHAADRSSSLPVVVVPISPQDAVACKADWSSLAQYQPNGLLSLQMLKDEGMLEEGLLDRLPSGFHTTVTGLVRAFGEIGEQVDEEVILNALFVRGGEPGRVNAVVYAEDLVPFVKEGEEGFDAVFWEGIEELKRENTRSGLVDLLAWAHGDEEGGSGSETSV